MEVDPSDDVVTRREGDEKGWWAVSARAREMFTRLLPSRGGAAQATCPVKDDAIEIGSLHRAGEAKEKEWRAINECDAKARKELAARDAEILRKDRAGEEQEKKWRAINECDAKARKELAARDAEILRKSHIFSVAAEDVVRLGVAKEKLSKAGLRIAVERSGQLLQACEERARAGLAATEETLVCARKEHETQISGLGRALAEQEGRLRAIFACNAKARDALTARHVHELAGRDSEIARLGSAGELQEKALWAALTTRDQEIQEQASTAQTMQTEIDQLRSELTSREGALAAKDDSIVRLGLAEVALSEEVAELRAAGEQSEGKFRQLLQTNAESAREKLAATESHLLLCRKECKKQATALAARDAEITRLGRAGEDQERARRAALTAKDAEIKQLLDANALLWASRDAAVALISGKDAAIARLGLAQGVLTQEVAGLRSDCKAGVEARNTLGKRWREAACELEGRVVEAKRVRPRLPLEGAIYDTHSVGLGLSVRPVCSRCCFWQRLVR